MVPEYKDRKGKDRVASLTLNPKKVWIDLAWVLYILDVLFYVLLVIKSYCVKQHHD